MKCDISINTFCEESQKYTFCTVLSCPLSSLIERYKGKYKSCKKVVD